MASKFNWKLGNGQEIKFSAAKWWEREAEKNGFAIELRPPRSGHQGTCDFTVVKK